MLPSLKFSSFSLGSIFWRWYLSLLPKISPAAQQCLIRVAAAQSHSQGNLCDQLTIVQDNGLLLLMYDQQLGFHGVQAVVQSAFKMRLGVEIWIEGGARGLCVAEGGLY